MRKMKLQKPQIRFLNSIIKESIKAFRNWVDEGLSYREHYVREDLELKLNEIGKKYGVVLHDYLWIVDNHMNPEISVEEKMKTLENFCISLPFDENDFEYQEERGKHSSWIWTFRSDPKSIKETIRFKLYSQDDSRCAEFELAEDEFIIDCHGKDCEKEESEKLSEEYLKSFFSMMRYPAPRPVLRD